MPSKESLDNAECTQLVRLCTEVNMQCRTCIAIMDTRYSAVLSYWQNTFRPAEPTMHALKMLSALLDSNFVDCLKEIYSFVGDFDFKEIRANGMRSFLLIIARCLTSVLTYLRNLNTYSLATWSGSTERLLVAYINCFAELHLCAELLKNLPRFCAPGSLFPRSIFTDLPEIGQCAVGSIPGVHLYTKDDEQNKPEARNVPVELNKDLLQFQKLQTRFDGIKQEHFYGHCLAFYFCPSAQRLLMILGSVMAGYGNTYLESKQGISNLVYTVCRSVSSLLSPEARGLVMANLTRNANVEFCKAFWSLAEHPIVSGSPNIILPTMALVHEFELLPRLLRVPLKTPMHTSTTSTEDELDTEDSRFLSVLYPVSHFGPSPVSVRLLSYRFRPGMEWARKNLLSSLLQSSNRVTKPNDFGITDPKIHEPKSGRSSISSSTALPSDAPRSKSRRTRLPTVQSEPVSLLSASATATDQQLRNTSSLSPYLLFHIHGGGFVALKSQSQDIFLRQWAEFLDCPIFSVDYSLAPKAPYPRALEECFFAYCWAALNRERLGAAPDARIVLCGDSAGGNLTLGLCLRIAHTGILPKPHGAFIAYAPILISFSPSPARMLSLSDPLLPIGILSKCLLAYAGVDESRLNPPNQPAKLNEKMDENHPPIARRSTLSNLLWGHIVPSMWNTTSLSPSASSDTQTPSTGHTSSPSSLSLVKSFFDFAAISPNPAKPTPDSYRTLPSSQNNHYPNQLEVASFTSLRKPATPKSAPTEPCTFRLADSDSELTSELAPNDHDRFSHPADNTDCSTSVSDLDRVRRIRFSQDSFMSPYLASDELMSQLPPLAIVCSNMDPFLDDCLELAKRAARLSVPLDLRILDDLPHAFLNFAPLGPEFQHANQICMEMVKKLFEHEPHTRTGDSVTSPVGSCNFQSFEDRDSPDISIQSKR
ncbi:putative hormone-sensitive lipase [Paragonimus heterotremus]|uniref:Putative hormone-sensitive lipase n=1 Tax=Paragonimus heterotremus TaxID=100268 RepID=A0A8J4WGL6_9TREM|nr:putative hormone-sensitive lipase [Paragonimus heterotremus]